MAPPAARVKIEVTMVTLIVTVMRIEMLLAVTDTNGHGQ